MGGAVKLYLTIWETIPNYRSMGSIFLTKNMAEKEIETVERLGHGRKRLVEVEVPDDYRPNRWKHLKQSGHSKT